MTDRTTVSSDTNPAPPPAPLRQQSVPAWLWVMFVLMLGLAVLGATYATSMSRFLSEGGYFIAYGSLCNTVPIMAGLDRFAPLVLTAAWLGVIFFGVTKSHLFYRSAVTVSLVSIIYGAADLVVGPFTFRVGPADIDPATMECGRWPLAIRGDTSLEIMRMDWLNVPIGTFPLGMVLVAMTIFVYLRISRRVAAVYRNPD